MGIEVPDDWPDLTPDAYFCVQVLCYSSLPPGTGCTGDPEWMQGCVKGRVLIDWISRDMQCSDIGILGFPGHMSQRIIDIDGPFDTLAECAASGCHM
jgi:hypothetical protein